MPVDPVTPQTARYHHNHRTPSDERDIKSFLEDAANGRNGLVRRWLKAGLPADIVLPRPGLETAMAVAVNRGHIKVVRALLDGGASPSLLVFDDALSYLTVLMARRVWEYKPTESAQIADALLAAGADINAIDRFGSTALMWAASHGNASAVAWLLNHGADAQKVSFYGKTALSLAREAQDLNRNEAREATTLLQAVHDACDLRAAAPAIAAAAPPQTRRSRRL